MSIFFCQIYISISTPRQPSGSQDIVAKEKRNYSSSIECSSIYSDSKFAVERIHSPGYHYNPVSKDTYGVTPRMINTRDYATRVSLFRDFWEWKLFLNNHTKQVTQIEATRFLLFVTVTLTNWQCQTTLRTSKQAKFAQTNFFFFLFSAALSPFLKCVKHVALPRSSVRLKRTTTTSTSPG